MDNLVFRTLNGDDWNKNYFNLLSQLTDAVELDENTFKNLLNEIKKTSEIYVYEDIVNNKIVATAKLLIEQKLARGGGKVGHLEDVVVDVGYRKLGLGGKLVINIIDLARQSGCYKLIGNCTLDLIGYYEKIGFSNKGTQFAIYF